MIVRIEVVLRRDEGPRLPLEEASDLLVEEIQGLDSIEDGDSLYVIEAVRRIVSLDDA